MNQSLPFAVNASRYELRFTSLFNRGRGYAFPCDAEGCVEMGTLSDHGRSNYLYARVVVGNELAIPIVVHLPDPSHFVHTGHLN